MQKTMSNIVTGIISFSSMMALWTYDVFAQTTNWEKPITDYADNLLSGVQSVIAIVGVLVVIALFGWGFTTQDTRKYTWALGGIVIIVLVQFAPQLIASLTDISTGS